MRAGIKPLHSFWTERAGLGRLDPGPPQRAFGEVAVSRLTPAKRIVINRVAVHISTVFPSLESATSRMAAPMQLRPAMQVHGSAKSSFRGLTTSFSQLSVAPTAVARTAKLQVEGEWGPGDRRLASRRCPRGREGSVAQLIIHFRGINGSSAAIMCFFSCTSRSITHSHVFPSSITPLAHQPPASATSLASGRTTGTS